MLCVEEMDMKILCYYFMMGTVYSAFCFRHVSKNLWASFYEVIPPEMSNGVIFLNLSILLY